MELWSPALENLGTLAPNIWLDYSIINFYLLARWYQHFPHNRVRYIDSSAVDSWQIPEGMLNYQHYLDNFIRPRFRKRYMLPMEGPCPHEPLFIVIRHSEHFFPVCIDRGTVYVLGRSSAWKQVDKWEEWNGPQILAHLYYLHGWPSTHLRQVNVLSVNWKMNGYDCGPVAIAVADYLVENGIPQDGFTMAVKVAEACHHTTRLKILRFLVQTLQSSVDDYNFLKQNPPLEWSSFELSDIDNNTVYGPVDLRLQNILHQYHQPRHNVFQTLQICITGCLRCQRSLRKKPSSPEQSPHPHAIDNPVDRTIPAPILTDPIPAEEEALPEPEPNFQPVAKRGALRKKRRETNWSLGLEVRWVRTKPACFIEEPQRPLWPEHDLKFDDYFGGPHRDDMKAFEDPIYTFRDDGPFTSFTRKSCWTTFRDYGWRLLTRFAHQYYLGDPMSLSHHIMPIGINPQLYNPEQFYSLHHIIPRDIGRSALNDVRTITSSDVLLLSCSEMLRKAQPGPEELMDTFVKGICEDGKYICVDMERDGLPDHKVSIHGTIDVDSFIWVTHKPKVKAPIALMVTPCIRETAPIRKHNHIYADILYPPTAEETTYSWMERSWLEKRKPISNIPHCLFAKITEGSSPVLIYIAFPRMIHQHEYTKRHMALIPLEVQALFWDKVLLPALHHVVQSTSTEPFYEFTIEKNIRKGPGRKKPTANLYHGISRIIPPQYFTLIQEKMKDILKLTLDSSLSDRFISFFFIVECNGFKLNVISHNGARAMPELERLLPGLDFEYMLNRENGELHVDVGFCYQPKLTSDAPSGKKGVVGLWRLDALEESFSAGGYLSGKVHHVNTLSRYGGIQAEMSLERSRRTHVAFRSSYNLQYEAVRKKDNDPFLCGDGDAYEYNLAFQTACKERVKQYGDRGDRNYGVRDEYRVSGKAAVWLLNHAEEVVSLNQPTITK